ncbi:MAG: EF-P beta-lysylation protein EpmB [Congregibacter sp.]
MRKARIKLTALERPSWQTQLKTAIRTPEALADAVGLTLAQLPYSAHADQQFALLVPEAFAARMERGNPDDPLLRQVLADTREDIETAGYTADPLEETGRYAGDPGVLQKYTSRALLIVTGQCAVNCRYCFRRHYPYAQARQSSEARRASLKKLLDDPAIEEIILSGGDPLMLPDQQLAAISRQLRGYSRPVTLRVHTRLPIVIPDRVTGSLLNALDPKNVQTVVVVHANHPREIDGHTSAALERLRDAGITVLNQSVLLRGINDCAETLAALNRRLFAAGTLPYYLHTMDPVQGAAHFDSGIEDARRITAELAEQCPGYLVPKLVTETPGARSKRQLAPSYPALP